MRNVLVTGANGFVGRPLCRYLTNAGWRVVAAVREHASQVPSEVSEVRIAPDVTEAHEWSAVCRDMQAVVHLVARTHVMQEQAPDPEQAYHSINVEGSLRVLRGAIAAGVDRFVYLSSIKAVGEGADFAYHEQTPLNPEDAYGRSKAAAEAALIDAAAGTHTGCQIVRPPLVYGPAVRGNLARLIRLVRRGLPLPLASVDNARSMVHVDNLASAIGTILRRPENPSDRGPVFHVADQQAFSTPELLRCIAAAAGQSARLFPTPVFALRWAAKLIGAEAEMRRLTGSLTVDTHKLRTQLDWKPPRDGREGVSQMVRDALAANAKGSNRFDTDRPAARAA